MENCQLIILLLLKNTKKQNRLKLQGSLLPGLPIGTVWITPHSAGPHTVFAKWDFLPVVATPMTVVTYPHSHMFPNLPLNLKDSNKDVRKEAKANENPITNPARPIVNGKK